MDYAPRAIAIAASKGGTGKTTLTSALAVQAMRDGFEVGLVDWEPQGSLTLWWLMRGKPSNPYLIRDVEDPERAVLSATGACDLVFLDTAPSSMDQIELAIEAADFVLIPVTSSAFDLMAARSIVDICKEHDKPFAFVLNRQNARRDALNSSARSHLLKLCEVLEESVQDRTAYVSALNKGKAGPEHPDTKQAREARAEIEALWAAVKARAYRELEVA